MTVEQALDLLADLRDRFPRIEIPQETIQAYAADITDLEYATAADVIRNLGRESEFWPSVRSIRAGYAEVKLAAPDLSSAFVQASDKDIPKGTRHPLVEEARDRVGDRHEWATAETTDLWHRFRLTYPEVVAAATKAIVRGNAPGPTLAALPESDKLIPRSV